MAPVGKTETGNVTIDKSLGGIKNTYNIYLPGNSPYTPSTMLIRPYPIRVWYDARVSDTFFGAQTTDWPYVKVTSCTASGVLDNELIDVSRGQNKTGFFDLPLNLGMNLEMYTGKLVNMAGNSFGFDCSCHLEYQLDTAPPDSPVLAVKDLGSPEFREINGKVHSRLQPVRLEWNIPKEHGTLYNGFKSGPGGVTGYLAKINGTNTTWFTQTYYNLTGEGEYQITVKARDFDNNQSGFSVPVTVVLDRSIDPATLPANPIRVDLQTDGRYSIVFTWNQVQDVSGITYQVALTQSVYQPTDYEIINPASGALQYTFPNREYINSAYYAWVRAIDGVGNTTSWVRTNEISLYSPPAGITKVEPQAALVNDQAAYEIRLTVEEVDAVQYIIERQNEGEPATRVTLAEISHPQMLQNEFRYTDTESLFKHGQYRYFVSTKNGNGVKSGERVSGMVAIPNIQADFTVNGPADQLNTGERAQTFDITPKQDGEGDQLKFRVCYTSGNTIYRSSETLQSEPVVINFSNGNWEWWLEVAENSNSKTVSGSTRFTSNRTFRVQALNESLLLLPEEIETTPGKPVRFETTALKISGPVTEYSWDSGDGATLVGIAPEYVYTKLGDYPINLAVKDQNGTVYLGTTLVKVKNTASGQLYMDEVWSGTHNLDGPVTVPTGINLTIQPGTRVVLNGAEETSLIINGSLNIPGGESGVEFSPANGETASWKGIYVEGQAFLNSVTLCRAERGLAAVAGSTVNLVNCVFRENQVGLHVYGAGASVSNSSFINNTLYGIKEDEGGRAVVVDCVFSGNGMNYYHDTLTEITMDQLNEITGNRGNR
jgi:hypothetical protein